MARPRKTDPRPLIRPLIEEFATELASAVERTTLARVLELIDGHLVEDGRSPLRSARKRAVSTCYYPGCKNVAAPRFGMFCAALHKGISKSEKERYRAQRAQA